MLGKKCIAILTGLAATVLLSGCATQAEIEAQKAAVVEYVSSYDPSHSYAWNLGKSIDRRERLKDAYVDDALLNHSITISNKTVWAIGNAIEWNPLSVGSAMLLLIPTQKEVLSCPAYIGFIPKREIPDMWQAQVKFAKDLSNAWRYAMAKMGYTVQKTNVPGSFLHMHSPKSKDLFASVEITPITHFYVQSMKMPEWIEPSGEEVWAFGVLPASQIISESLTVKTTEGFDISLKTMNAEKDVKIQLLKDVATKLPKNAFMYVPAIRDGNGDWQPAYFTSNKQRFDFVMPKSAEPKAQ